MAIAMTKTTCSPLIMSLGMCLSQVSVLAVELITRTWGRGTSISSPGPVTDNIHADKTALNTNKSNKPYMTWLQALRSEIRLNSLLVSKISLNNVQNITQIRLMGNLSRRWHTVNFQPRKFRITMSSIHCNNCLQIVPTNKSKIFVFL